MFGALALVLSALPASAETTLGFGGGANWDDVISSPFVSTDTGFVMAATLETSTSIPGLRFGGELSFRSNDVTVDPCGCFPINATHATTALMGNMIYEFETKAWPVHPFVLVGAGVAHTEGTFENVSLLKVENTGFVWQLGAGATTEVSPGVHLDVSYRYFAAPDITVLGTELSDGTNQAVMFGARFALN
jgi:opacity protein-like surface antigen